MDEVQTLQSARAAIKQGDRETACKLLQQIIQTNPQQETAWLWLSALVGDPEREAECLQRVLAINPNNAVAQRHLQQLEEQNSAADPPAAAGDTPSWLVRRAEPTSPSSTTAAGGIPAAPAVTPPNDDAPSWLVRRPEPAPSFSVRATGQVSTSAPAEAAVQTSPPPTTLELYGAGFVLPCISPTFYNQAARFRLGTALGFFLLFALAVSTVQILQTYRNMGAMARQAAASFASGKWPEITISRGRASVRGRQPFVYEAGDAVLIVDTTGRYSATSLSSGRYRSGFLLTETNLYNLSNGELQALKLGELQALLGDPFVLDAVKIKGLLDGFQLIVFVLLFLWNILVRLIYLAVVAVAVWGISRAFGPRLSYGQVFALGLYAVVPAIYGTHLLQRVGIGFCGLSTLILVVAWGVGVFMVTKQRQTGLWSVKRPLRTWRALLGLPMVLVLALDAIMGWSFGAAASWIVTLLTLAGLAFVGLWPMMAGEQGTA